MATRFRKLSTRRVKRRHSLKTRKQRGGITLFGKKMTLPSFGRKTPSLPTATGTPAVSTIPNPSSASNLTNKQRQKMEIIQAAVARNRERYRKELEAKLAEEDKRRAEMHEAMEAVRKGRENAMLRSPNNTTSDPGALNP